MMPWQRHAYLRNAQWLGYRPVGVVTASYRLPERLGQICGEGDLHDMRMMKGDVEVENT